MLLIVLFLFYVPFVHHGMTSVQGAVLMPRPGIALKESSSTGVGKTLHVEAARNADENDSASQTLDNLLIVDRQIVCTKTLSCYDSQAYRDEWHERRLHAIALASNRSDFPYSPFIFERMCRDTHTAGFLLDAESENWPLACTWTASDGNASCAFAPPSNRVIYYLTPYEWQLKLIEFRRTIGCPATQIEAVNSVGELYVCRKRCTESGVGYLPSIIMASSILTIMALFLSEE